MLRRDRKNGCIKRIAKDNKRRKRKILVGIKKINRVINRIIKIVRGKNIRRIRLVLIKLIVIIWLRIEEKIRKLRIEEFELRLRINGKWIGRELK